MSVTKFALVVACCAVTLCSCRGLAPANRLAVTTLPGRAATLPAADASPAAVDSASAPVARVNHTHPVAAPSVASYRLEDEPTLAPEVATPAGPPSLDPLVQPAGHRPRNAYCCPAPMPMMPGCAPPSGIGAPPMNPCAPWPADEYLIDGGDRDPQVRVADDRRVAGLDLQDTVVHYETVDGKRCVQPSNCVPIYAPRFASVRKIYGVLQHEGHERIAGVELPVEAIRQDDVQIASSVNQPLPPVAELGLKGPDVFRERLKGIGLDTVHTPLSANGDLLPYEDFTLIRRGLYANTEKARLADRVAAAITWTLPQAVQVIVDNLTLIEAANEQSAEVFTVYELPEGKCRMRICKIASRGDARPGEVVDFTLRFDNLGDQPVRNVTIIDNLTTRLEYVDQSQQCSKKAAFHTVENVGESLILRWDIQDEIAVGEGGIIRFQCKVR